MAKEKRAKMILLIDLPDGILADILSRLPVNNIVACQCVCKSWNELIAQSYFKELQLRRVICQPRRIMLSIRENDQLFWMNIEANNNAGTLDARIEAIPIGNDSEKFCFKAYSNGMHFMVGMNQQIPNTIHMCNPIMNDCVELPYSNIRMQHEMGFGYGFGFGFDYVNNKYKVIHVYAAGSGSDCCTQGEILTLGENLWRTLEFPCSIRNSSPKPVFSNGEFYWLIKKKSNPSCLERVLVFDIVTEKFETMIRPPASLELADDFELINFGVSPALVERYMMDTDLFEVWRIVGNATEGRRFHLCTYDLSALGRQFKSDMHIVGMLSDGTLMFEGSDWINDHHDCDSECFHIALYFPLTKTGLVVADDEYMYTWASVLVPSPLSPSKLLG